MNAFSKIEASIHAPGVYLDLPEDEYHADPSLSASGVKLLNVSPLDFWVNSPMNPNRKEDTTSEAKERGKAIHKMVLEGPEAFDASYAVAPAKEDYPDALDGSDALKERCKDLGLAVGGTIAALCDRIRGADPEALLWPDIKTRFGIELGLRKALKKDDWIDAKLIEQMLDRMPSTKKALRGGVPEVSIFWRDADFDGLPMKVRLDKLTPGAIFDLKSFANVMNKEITAAVTGEISRCRYFAQPPIYCRGLLAAREMFERRGDAVIFGDGQRDEILRCLAKPEPGARLPRFFFVFVQTGHVPNIVVREFAQRETNLGGQDNLYWFRGEAEFRRGVSLYRQCLAAFKPGEPWVTDFGVKAFRDDDFPIWALEAPEVSV